ncbi:UDP-4-amino-4,6-dideoxy-N-acetyl-beta-L-altrosamine transaminase [Shewanella mangrovisoli]|uniref:UDP-4-amino-4, 6-dideoxy-N-acetyl-beta-L-altrosamine transaminase n=1 Tax=Shewanella mangrovisoli TaxID=2864211 RepID=UPI000025C464
MIPYGRQDINQADIDAVIEVLQSDYLTQGPKVPEFETAVASYCFARYGVAVNSATSALHIACLALGIGQNDIVWTSPITFVASANCALYCGAEIDFVDVNPLSGNMCPDALAIKLEHAAQIGKLPKALIPVHLCGHSCDMVAISTLAKQYDIKLIEDASHAIGGCFQGHKMGSCHYSDITIFSFHPVKVITSAEGGMAITNDLELAEKMRLFRSHGISRDVVSMERPNEGAWYYEQHLLGFNYRMTDLQAALGLSQLARLDEFVATRNTLAGAYDKAFCHYPIVPVNPIEDSVSARHLYVIRLNDAQKRRQCFEHMRSKNIWVNVHYFPVHLQPYYLKQGFKEGDLPRAEAFYQQILTLPLYPSMTNIEQNSVIKTLLEVL